MINIMIVDDHAIFRESLQLLIEKDKNMKVVCNVSNETECINGLRFHEIDIILLDLFLKDKSGFSILEFIIKKKINVKVIILTSHTDSELMIKAMNIGANGYLTKYVDSVELFKAINQVHRGNNYLQNDLIPFFNNYLINSESDRDKIYSLTNRELELLRMVASGLKNIDIANKMNISERTVKNHLTHVFNKLDVADRTQAAVFAIKNNLTSI